MRTQTSALGRTKLEPPARKTLRPFLDSLTAAADIVVAAAEDFGDADANTLIYVGMDLALAQLSRSPGSTGRSTSRSDQSQTLDELLEAADQENARGFDADLAERVRRLMRNLAYAALLTDPELVKQLLPPGSSNASRFAAWVRYDSQGNPTVTIPERGRKMETGNDPASWNSFIDAVSAEQETQGSILGEAISEIDDEAERFELRRGD